MARLGSTLDGMRRALFCSIAVLLAGCSGPWDDLAARYKDKDAPSLGDTDRTIVLAGTNHQGAFSMRGLASYQLDKSGVRLAVSSPLSFLYPPVHIPTKAVTACSRISWSATFDTPLWLSDAKVEVVLRGHEKETLEWCKAMSIPVVSRDLEWKWLRGSTEGMPSNSTPHPDAEPHPIK